MRNVRAARLLLLSCRGVAVPSDATRGTAAKWINTGIQFRSTSCSMLSASLPAASSAVLESYRALFNGVREGNEPSVRSLLAKGMEVNLRGPRGATPLHIVRASGSWAW